MNYNLVKFIKINLLVIGLVLLCSTAWADYKTSNLTPYQLQRVSSNIAANTSSQNLTVVDLIRSGDKYDALYKADRSKLSDEKLALMKAEIDSEKQVEAKEWSDIGNNCFTVLCDVAIIYIPLSMCM